MEDFRHYTSDPNFAIDVREYSLQNIARPEGVWLSIEDSWLEWCRAHRTWKNKLNYWYTILIDADASILRIDSERELVAFTKEYGKTKLSDYLWPDWARVCSEFQGIIITLPCEPHLWRDDPVTRWYVPWSCPSGCVWDTTVLTLVGSAIRTVGVPRHRVRYVPSATDDTR